MNYTYPFVSKLEKFEVTVGKYRRSNAIANGLTISLRPVNAFRGTMRCNERDPRLLERCTIYVSIAINRLDFLVDLTPVHVVPVSARKETEGTTNGEGKRAGERSRRTNNFPWR